VSGLTRKTKQAQLKWSRVRRGIDHLSHDFFGVDAGWGVGLY